MSTEIQYKLCINCKHIGRNGSGDANNYRCFAEQNVIKRDVDLVTGAAVIYRHHDTCYAARGDTVWGREYNGERPSCGKIGRWFEAAPPKLQPSPSDFGPKASRLGADDLLSQLDSMP